jgi:hypothetical protein
MMRKNYLTLLLLPVCGISVFAAEFHPVGFESISMGGAGVASAKGSMAGYYNPALLAKDGYDTEASAGFGTGHREVNIADSIDRLRSYDFSATVDRIAANAPSDGTNSAEDRDNIIGAQEVIADFPSDNGISLLSSVGFGIQAGHFGLGIYSASDASATAVVSNEHTELIVREGSGYYAYDPETDHYSLSSKGAYEGTSLEYALNNGLTYLQLNGLAITEVPISYAFSLDTGAGRIAFGGSLKYLNAVTYARAVDIDTKSGDIKSEVKRDGRTGSAFGVDAGLLYMPAGGALTLGIVGKHLNSPEFELPEGGAFYTLEPMVRAGIAYRLADAVDLAVDLDITENEALVPGYRSRYAGGGININPLSWLSLRAGVMKNLSEEPEGTVFTAGLGFGLKWVQIDIAGQFASEQGTFDGDEVPRYSRLNVALVSRW